MLSLKADDRQVKSFRTSVRVALARRDWSINKLAARVRRPRETVSRAINSNRFPLVRARIAEVLGLS